MIYHYERKNHKMPRDRYYIVFDTNTLYVDFKSHGDFTGFSFNQTFDHVVATIEKFDMHEHISILVPSIVYEEMKMQEISAHDDKKEILQKAIGKSIFPGFHHTFDEINYEEYISNRIAEYKNQLVSGQVFVDELSLPSEKRFESIVNRAFAKQPPFLGVEKRSDKGFKDALLWESILEFKESNSQVQIIFYSKDNGFCDVLTNEFQAIFNDPIFICKNEAELEAQLKFWAKTIDEYVYIPEDISEEEKTSFMFLEWFGSTDFHEQLAGLFSVK